MRLSIRHWLLAVAFCGAVTSAVSLIGLSRLMTMSGTARLERARESVSSELDRLATAKDPATPLPWKLIGIRGGTLPDSKTDDYIANMVEPTYRTALTEALRQSAGAGQRRFSEEKVDTSTMIVGVAPAEKGGRVWAGYLVTAPTFFRMWQAILFSMTLATSLLVASSLVAVVSMRRGAATLKQTLEILPRDLSMTVPRPNVRELSDVADGIASLAGELFRAQKEQARLARELSEQDRLAALGRVAAGVAHEVRNPLAAMKLRVDLASSSPGVPAEVSRELATVGAEIDRLDRLVADLLVVAGRRSGPRLETALGALVTNRVKQLSIWASEHDVDLAVTGDARATVDPDAVARAVDNLVRNAVEASPPGGTVSIEIRDQDDVASVHVLDDGPGVSEDRVHELFEPFFTTKADGTGLGLALSRAIAHAQRGTLTYVREKRCTRFELSFPHSSPVTRSAA